MEKHEVDMLKKYKGLIEEELYKDLGKDMKTCSCDYNRHKMVSSIIQTMCNIDKMTKNYDKEHNSYEKPVTYATYDGTEQNEDNWWHNEKHEITTEQELNWASKMKNADGTTGAHWSLDQTTAVAEQNGVMFDHISATDWMITLNMIYSDYGETLKSNGVTDTSVYAQMAKDFLFDEDAVPPKEKLYYYYRCITKH